MNIFEKAIEDIFNTKQFFEYAYVNNKKIKIIVYQMSVGEQISIYGNDDGVSFYISCKTEDYQPQKGDKIRVRKEDYKVMEHTIDSYGICNNIFLKSITSR